MHMTHLIDIANDSGGTLYLMMVLMTIALTVIIERSRYLSNMLEAGDQLIRLLKSRSAESHSGLSDIFQKYPKLPHRNLIDAASSAQPATRADRESMDSTLEEAVMHEVPKLDRSLWMLDTIITLAPLLGLFGTILGMFNAFSVLGSGQDAATQVTSGIAEALLATASGLVVAMVGLIFFNSLNTRIRLVVHQMETLKIMILNRADATIQGHLQAL
ncbi:MAG: MotA/TolQ/ExbB proton channel family protein [Betaproteobacteria bacterium]|nr:MotA/TolQ/ExbB proton channel family protein [Betaproteobacteria bacterium]